CLIYINITDIRLSYPEMGYAADHCSCISKSGREAMYRYLFILSFFALPAVAGEESDIPMSRGEMLYRNHCIECHHQQIQWREAQIAKDLDGIEREVRRWQDAIGMKW